MYKWSAEAVSCLHVVFGNEESTKWNRNSSGVHRLHQPSELCKFCLVLPVLNVRMIHPWFYDLMNSGESYCVAESKYLHGVIHILLRVDHMYTHSEYCGSSSCWKRQRQRCLWVFFLSDSLISEDMISETARQLTTMFFKAFIKSWRWA